MLNFRRFALREKTLSSEPDPEPCSGPEESLFPKVSAPTGRGAK